MRAVIADTGPLYAALDIDDQYHERAQAELQLIEAKNLTIVVAFPVYLETYNLLLYRLGTEQAISFAQQCIGAVSNFGLMGGVFSFKFRHFDFHNTWIDTVSSGSVNFRFRD